MLQSRNLHTLLKVLLPSITAIARPGMLQRSRVSEARASKALSNGDLSLDLNGTWSGIENGRIQRSM